ncbi:MAG: phosphoglycerate kinase [Candidatus Doudnabacteria bacterium CG10_big_fil_rev_8_21_14_0_10_42_18]|uniref:Phosphoglycerate kinase n=1 Tax=Candidatus Doudnabacteria bacterium CG10_big_fil_rev_8_21_14_0_10_42_18 TaxID=1974552 RepID=A0A2H0VB60_9BACT|nr:MAG: phosphoglycerate kinase [Candidatus Doudnabacteria bacterium CG10_big_fil_rev_8_21_14_0_10_42_18]
MAISFLKSSTLKNKTVLLRADVNVPLDNGKVADDFRIVSILPTVKLLQKGGNKIILCGHLGRPKGEPEEKYSLKPVAKHLADLLNLKFIETDHKIPDYQIPHLIFYSGRILEEKHQRQLKNIHARDIVVLENLRFYPGEKENDAVFAKHLSVLADVYVNEAFGVDHRKASSVSAITKYLKSYAGPLLEKEIKGLDAVLKKPKKPFVVLMGGIKISDKVQTMENLGKNADKILVGGGIANLFFLAKELEVGLSKVEKEAVKTAWQLQRNFKDKLVLPVDLVVANENMDKNSIRVTTPYEIGKKEMVLDAGPKTILEFAKHLKTAKTIVWNGPLGLFEKKPFHHATFALARLIGGRGKGIAYTVIGGGETVDAARQAGQEDYIDHVSTGGGAMLEYLAGKKLPGIEALK